MSGLSGKRCIPCEEGAEKLSKEQAQDLMAQVPGWTLSEDATALTRSYAFKDFAKALEFANKVGALAEEEWHHPELVVGWGKVDITFTTRSIRGLAENDFIMAAKVNML